MGILDTFAQSRLLRELTAPYRDAAKALRPTEPYVMVFDDGQFRPVKSSGLSGDGGALFRRNSFAGIMGGDVGAATATQLCVWVYACMTARMDEVAQIPFHIVQKSNRKPLEDHPILDAMRAVRREEGTSLVALIEASACIFGETYVEMTRTRAPFSQPGGLNWLNPIAVVPVVKNGRVVGFDYMDGARYHRFSRDEVAYSRQFNPGDDTRGLSPLQVALESVNTDLYIKRSVNAYFKNDAMPRGLIVPSKGTVITPDEKERLSDEWNRSFKGVDKKWKVGFLTAAMDYLRLQDKPDLANVELEQGAREQICAAFRVPVSRAGAWDSPRYQMNPESTRAFYAGLVRPRARDIQELMNDYVVPFFDPRETVRFEFDFHDIDALVEDAEKKASIWNQRLAAGGVTLNQWREAQGMDAIPTGDVYQVPMNVQYVKEADLGKSPEPPPAPASAPVRPRGRNEQATPNAQPPEAVQRKSTDVETDDLSAFAYLDLSHDASIMAAREQVKAALGSVEGIDWQDPNTFHVTLVYVKDIPDATLSGVVRAIDGSATAITSNSLGLFENGESRALHLVVEASPALKALQRAIYRQFESRDVPLSEFSNPNQYKPHITLAYLPVGVDMPKVSVSVATTARKVAIGRDDYAVFTEIALSSVENPTASALRAWRKKIENKGKAVGFESDAIPHALEHRIADEMTLCDGDLPALKAVLNAALLDLNHEPSAATALKAVRDARLTEDALNDALRFLRERGYAALDYVGLGVVSREQTLTPPDDLPDASPLLSHLEAGKVYYNNRALDLAQRLVAREIDTTTWREEMKRLLLWLWTLSWLAGSGAVERLTLAGVRALETAVAEQYTYLAGWAAALAETVTPNARQMAARARLYAEASEGFFWESYTVAAGLPTLPFQPKLFTKCAMNCHCTWDIKKLDGVGNYDCTWRMADIEHCETCVRRSVVANPLQIRNGVIEPFDSTGVYA